MWTNSRRAVIGAAIEVRRHLGPGFLESVYQRAMVVEMGLRGIPFERHKPVSVRYKSVVVGEGELDFLVGGKLVVEFKAVEDIPPIFMAKVLHYLKASNCRLALLVNFRVPLLKSGIRRIVWSGASK
jgi:GxxExxY protein